MTPELKPVRLELASFARQGSTIYTHMGEFDGSVLAVTYVLSDEEHRRRQAASFGALTNERTLAALMTLPMDGLGPVQRRFASVFDDPRTSAFAVIVEEPNGRKWGRNSLSAPLEVLAIEIKAPDWAHGCEVAHRWVGYGARMVHVDPAPDVDVAITLSEASHYGIGLLAGGNVEPLVAPSPYRPRRWTSARWRFAEMVYRQFLELSSSAS